MYRALHLLPVLLLAAAPVAAQDVIRPGQSVTGQLTAADPELDDGSHYDVWRFAAQARHRYRVTLRSADFDAYLSVGSRPRSATTARRTTTARAAPTRGWSSPGREDGTYVIRANSYDEGETGAYELTLEDEGVVDEEEHDAHEDAAEMGTPITLGEPVAGTLARGDRKVGTSYSDTWTYHGREGETIMVTLRSEDFDAYLTLGEFDGGECTEHGRQRQRRRRHRQPDHGGASRTTARSTST